MKTMTLISAPGRLTAALVLSGFLILAAGCDSTPSGSAGGDATFQLQVTGASGSSAVSAMQMAGDVHTANQETPMSAEQVAMAEIWVSRIYLVGGGDGHVDLFVADEENGALYLNLMALDDGVEVELTDPIPVPEDRYGQLRLVVDEALVTLAEGYTFSDGSNERVATVPSDFLRVNLNGDLVIEGGEEIVVLADFDVSRSFVFQGPPAAPLGVNIKPVLFQEVARNQN